MGCVEIIMGLLGLILIAFFAIIFIIAIMGTLIEYGTNYVVIYIVLSVITSILAIRFAKYKDKVILKYIKTCTFCSLITLAILIFIVEFVIIDYAGPVAVSCTVLGLANFILSFIGIFITDSIILRKNNKLAEKRENNKNKIIQDFLDKTSMDSFCDCTDPEISEDKLYLYKDLNFNIENIEPNTLWFDNNEKEEKVSEILNELEEKFSSVLDDSRNLVFNPREHNEKIYNFSKDCREYLLLHEAIKNHFNYLIRKRFSYYRNHIKSAEAGRIGEELINDTLDLYDNFYTLKSIRLEVEDNKGNMQSIESDNIIISKYGVFVLEVKNFGMLSDYDIIIERDGRWLKRYLNTGNVATMKNATDQNNRHIIYLNKLINKTLNRSMTDYIEVDGIVVIANNKVRITNNSDNQNIFRISELYSYIKKQPVVLTQEEMDKIKDVLESNNLEPLKFPINDYRYELEQNLTQFNDIVNNFNTNINELINEIDCFEQ